MAGDPRAHVTGGTVNAIIINGKSLAELIASQQLKVLLVDASGTSIVSDGAVSVSAEALPLPDNAAQETDGNLEVVAINAKALVGALEANTEELKRMRFALELAHGI